MGPSVVVRGQDDNEASEWQVGVNVAERGPDVVRGAGDVLDLDVGDGTAQDVAAVVGEKGKNHQGFRGNVAQHGGK